MRGSAGSRLGVSRACFNRGMAVNEKLKHTLIGAARVARSASLQVRDTAAPVIRQAARQVRSQLEQRRASPPPPEPPPPPTRVDEPEAAPAPAPEAKEAPAAPTPAVVAKNIAPKPAAAKPAAKRKPAKKAAPGAKLPVRRTADKPDSA